MNLKIKKTIIASGLILAAGSVSAEPVIDICPDDASKTIIHNVVKSLLNAVQA